MMLCCTSTSICSPSTMLETFTNTVFIFYKHTLKNRLSLHLLGAPQIEWKVLWGSPGNCLLSKAINSSWQWLGYLPEKQLNITNLFGNLLLTCKKMGNVNCQKNQAWPKLAAPEDWSHDPQQQVWQAGSLLWQNSYPNKRTLCLSNLVKEKIIFFT